ncbi:hypothetical protein PHLCEN_2v5850 [Hermanssonia centrifuga]|uniref:Uncharacterized protein n=1 Tax=Hermanssonia centrifuga TaxID=98765 RepID=A0A2R6P109_9APHY|nr:hypothetical protein PHLCEN_2v5850 [Hermanssonia centrifuga]
MSMRAFRLKVAKSFKVPKTEQGTMKLWLNMPDGILVELDNSEDIHDLSWWGLDDGSELVMFT